MGMGKVKFKDSKVSKFLKEKFPKVLESVGDVLPDKGLLGVVKNLVSNDNSQSDEVKAEALRMIQEYEMTELKEVTERWSNDMKSDSWLSKNVRPMTLLYLLLVMTVLVVGDSIENKFEVANVWITLIKDLLITVTVAYFGSRGAEKWKKMSN